MAAGLPGRLDVVVIGVDDLATTRVFYERLGWKSRPRDGLFARFELRGAALVLFPLDQLADAVGLPADRSPGFRGMTPAIVVDSAAELDAAVVAAREAGGKILCEPTDRAWGTRTAYVADPENNVWELATVVGA